MSPDDVPPLGLDDLAAADHEEFTAEGMGPGPGEDIVSPENVDAAYQIRESTLREVT